MEQEESFEKDPSSLSSESCACSLVLWRLIVTVNKHTIRHSLFLHDNTD